MVRLLRRRSPASARRAAADEISRAGYEVVGVEREVRIESKGCASSALEYFRQAEIDGVILVFHTFPARKVDRRGSRPSR
jgi:hypothetical protein